VCVCVCVCVCVQSEIEAKLNEACDVVIAELMLLYEPLWESPRDSFVSRQHAVRGLFTGAT